MIADVLTQAKEHLGHLRDRAKAAFATAADAEQRMTGPVTALQQMDAEERALVAQLEELRGRMVDTRREYDAIRAERQHYLVLGERTAAAADVYEQRALPEMERILAAPPEPVEQPPAGPVPPPRDETALVPAPADDLPFNVVDSCGADWLTSGSPLTTRADVAVPESGEPRHAKPKPKPDTSTGAFRAIVGRAFGGTDTTPDEQQQEDPR